MQTKIWAKLHCANRCAANVIRSGSAAHGQTLKGLLHVTPMFYMVALAATCELNAGSRTIAAQRIRPITTPNTQPGSSQPASATPCVQREIADSTPTAPARNKDEFLGKLKDASQNKCARTKCICLDIATTIVPAPLGLASGCGHTHNATSS